MDKKLTSLLGSFFFSTRLMAFLFIFFAASMAAGTFIESAYNTDTARIWVYNTWWFEATMFFFMVNFFGNIKRYQLYKREKWATLLLHLSFIFIIAGAFITRYISYEGMMPIREGESSNHFMSDKTYLTIFVDGMHNGKMSRKSKEKQLLMSPAVYPPFTSNYFNFSDTFDKIPYKIEYQDFIMGAKDSIKPVKGGTEFLKIVEAGSSGRENHFLKSGEVQNIHNLLFALNKPTPGAININTQGKQYTIQSPFEGGFMRMADKLQGRVIKDTIQPLMMRSLYTMGNSRFVFPEAAITGEVTMVSNNDYKDKVTDDALVLKVSNEGQEKIVTLVGSKGKTGEPVSFKLGNLEYTLMYGSHTYETPFSIKLNDFVAEKYPGTEKSYSSYESKVTVMDGGKNFDYRIFMNHILDHKGYRFFQASFDPDEKGTVLSVNHDYWGTLITYIGYFILFFALMAILFDKNTRFGDLKKKLEAVKKKKEKLAAFILLFFCLQGFAQEHQHNEMTVQKADSIINKYKVNEKTAAMFGRLVIQDEGGRMKPINTFSSELLRKVSKKDSYKDMNSDQAFLSMTQFPMLWIEVPFIYMKPGNDSIRKIIGVDRDTKYVAFRQFFDEQGTYKLSPYLDEAYKTTTPDQFQKDFIESDRKVNLLNTALFGSILKIFPVPNDKNNKWVSYVETSQPSGTALDTIRNALPAFVNELSIAANNKKYTMANTYLTGIENYQKRYGAKVRPSDDKIDAEVAYNKYDIFKNLFWLYMTVGTLMLLLTIVNILVNSKYLRYVVDFFHIFIGLLFGLHTLGLIARWYISGHAPWSNAYESMIYVAWATMFFTLAFDRKSKLTVASGTFVASMILMIAHWNWTDPEIANLQPVLNSYWLMIHVAVIVASYGPFTLGMVLGVVSLILMLCTTKKNKAKMELHITEITYINELALTIGLVMLTIGNFLGGQWANESWGRYWGWDPKETWALISIMVYAFVIHARFVPLFRGKWVFNLMSIVAFYSVMMTYFGVNFYLTGLHSYASGDKVVTPNSVYISVVLLVILATASFFAYRKYYKKKNA